MAEFIIIFREVLEAGLIIGILYTYLNKVDQQSSIARMWQGVLVAIVLSIAGSFLFQILAGGFEGQAEKLFEGVVMIVAAVVLGSMIVWMAKNKNIADDLKAQASDALSTANAGWAIFSLAFIAVFREGIEIILFMYGLAAKQGAVSFLSSALGAALALGVSYAIFIQGKKVPLKTFTMSDILINLGYRNCLDIRLRRRRRRSSFRRSASGPTSGEHRLVFYGFGLLVQNPFLIF